MNEKLTYHLFLAGRYKLLSFRQKAAIFWFHVGQGLRVGREKRVDCVMGYSTGLAGVAAWVLSVLLRTKFVLRVPNVPENAYRFNAFGGDALSLFRESETLRHALREWYRTYCSGFWCYAAIGFT